MYAYLTQAQAAELRWWEAACCYKRRVSEDAYRFNTVSPPPPPHIRKVTNALGKRLGWTSQIAMCIPDFIARKWSDR